MNLVVIGSGSCVIKQDNRASSAYLLDFGEKLIMVDTGTGSTRNLEETGYSVDEVDAVVNTHRHPDHISDLIPLIQDKVVRSFTGKETDLKLYGPEGHKEYVRDRMNHEMVESPDSISGFGFELNVNTIEAEQRIFESVQMSSVEALHGPEGFTCLSLRFDSGGKSVVFTGDTDYNPVLEEFGLDADVLVADCSRPGDESVEGHMNVEECARLASEAEVGHLVLSHLYPEAEDQDLEKQASRIFSGEITVAEDNLRIDF